MSCDGMLECPYGGNGCGSDSHFPY
ncbi:hypothetical protein RDI58_028949 [Solanum bulbocastanum]|uniref:Uncharacterized protein n=1 Tax=Solanum bulbocastanum TaxID=147425 RepID=A0AAN8XZH4_SOLBU